MALCINSPKPDCESFSVPYTFPSFCAGKDAMSSSIAAGASWCETTVKIAISALFFFGTFSLMTPMPEAIVTVAKMNAKANNSRLDLKICFIKITVLVSNWKAILRIKFQCCYLLSKKNPATTPKIAMTGIDIYPNLYFNSFLLVDLTRSLKSPSRALYLSSFC